MFQARDLPLLGKEGKRAEERGEWGGTKQRERSEHPLKSRDSASLIFGKERYAKI